MKVMENILKILPAVVLICGALLVVWRGMRTKPDGTNNKASGGGPGNGTGGLR